MTHDVFQEQLVSDVEMGRSGMSYRERREDRVTTFYGLAPYSYGIQLHVVTNVGAMSIRG